jgi:hypothetical protein
VADKKSCEVLAMIVADRVFREEDTRNVHIAGTFNQVNAADFPALHPRMHVYLALGDLAGKHDIKIVMRYADAAGEETVATASFPVDLPESQRTIELNVMLQGLKFPHPGTVEIAFLMDGVLVTSRTLEVVKV